MGFSEPLQAFEDRRQQVAAEGEDLQSPAPQIAEAGSPASDSEDEADAPEPDSRVKSILDMLDEASDQDEPETYQQEPEQGSVTDTGHRPGTQPQRRPVWEDPEDAAAVVDISGRSRLRKLRQHEEEQSVTGDACLNAGVPVARVAVTHGHISLPTASLWHPSNRTACKTVLRSALQQGCNSLEAPPGIHIVSSAGQEYEQRLRQQHKKLHPRTSWARRRAAGPQPTEGGASEPSA